MQYLELKTKLRDFTVFSISDIEKVDSSFHKQRLSEWQKKDYVKKICNGYYVFSDVEINEPALYAIANRIYEPSYISLEMALSLYGIIPEAVYSVTSVTSRKTKNVHSPVGSFIYRKIRPEYLFGYSIREHGGLSYKIADLEKALLDYLYLNPKINDSDSFEGVRFSVSELKEKLNREKFTNYLQAFANKALERRARKFLSYLNNNA